MARRPMLRRLIGETLENKRLLAGDGHVSGEYEQPEFEPAHYEVEQADDHGLEYESGDDHGSDDSDRRQAELRAQLTGDTAAKGEAEYEAESEHGVVEQEFKVEVEHGPVGETLDVAIDGVVVGQVTIGATGRGRLRLASHPGENEQPLPADFPAVTSTSVVSVGSILSGAFDGSTVSSDDDSGNDDSGNDDSGNDDSGNDDSGNDDSQSESSNELEAVLRGDSAAQGKASFETESEHGGVKQEFSVRVAGADPNTTYDVVVDGVSVGQVTTNELGRGFLKLANGDDSHAPLPEGFPTIQPGSTITVGSILSGTFVSDDRHSGDVNDDQQVDDHDIDEVHRAIFGASHDDRFDLDRNQVVDARDASYLIEVLLDSVIGDANLDGVFDSSDLIEIFRAGEYEDGVAHNSTWKTGDWNGDNECDSSDLVYAFLHGHYESGRAAHRLADLAQVAQDDSDPRK